MGWDSRPRFWELGLVPVCLRKGRHVENRAIGSDEKEAAQVTAISLLSRDMSMLFELRQGACDAWFQQCDGYSGYAKIWNRF